MLSNGFRLLLTGTEHGGQRREHAEAAGTARAQRPFLLVCHEGMQSLTLARIVLPGTKHKIQRGEDAGEAGTSGGRQRHRAHHQAHLAGAER